MTSDSTENQIRLEGNLAMITIIPNYHPMLVHFTVALITTSLGTFILAKLLTPWKQ